MIVRAQDPQRFARELSPALQQHSNERTTRTTKVPTTAASTSCFAAACVVCVCQNVCGFAGVPCRRPETTSTHPPENASETDTSGGLQGTDDDVDDRVVSSCMYYIVFVRSLVRSAVLVCM